jgi:hypothetical protein
MRKLLTTLILGTALVVAGCSTTGPSQINFSAIVAGAQKACGFVIEATQLPIIQQIVAANPALNSADLVVATICAAVDAIPKSKTARKGEEKLTVPVVVNGHTYVITGTR